ncbi:MAG: protein translocase subunit SecD [Gemmataceae bacterium]
MKKQNYSVIFFIGIILAAAGVVGMATWNYVKGQSGVNYKLGVDLVGGTILVYEMDLTKFPDEKVPQGTSQQLAATLKRRIDPSDLYNVTVRPVSETRVEIILPTGGQHEMKQEEAAWNSLKEEVGKKFKAPEGGFKAELGQRGKLAQEVIAANPDADPKEIENFIKEHSKQEKARSLTTEEVERVKELIKQVGSLEFRILAGDTDDKEAMDAAKKYVDEAKTNAQRKTELESLAAVGRPPATPKERFTTRNDKLGAETFTYSWVELSRNFRWEHGLNNAIADPKETPASEQLNRVVGGRQLSSDDIERGAKELRDQWEKVADARKNGEAILLKGNLYFSREVPSIREASDGDKKFEYFILTRDPQPGTEVTGQYLIPSQTYAEGRTVHFTFNSDGGDLFGDLTKNNVGRQLAIVLDAQVASAANIKTRITTQGIIEGQASKEDADRLVSVLRSGALPATLKPLPVSENTMGATLGADTIYKGAFSVVLAFIAILAFMLVYYRFSGLVACIALLANLLLTVAIMILVNATFTLPGLAGLVLMLGMAVDANVLIYERLREERERGASIALAIRNGYDRAFPTIIDTHLSSIFTAIVLYAVGNDQLKGFGISLTLGLIISLLTSLAMTRVIFNICLAKGWIHDLSMLHLRNLPGFRMILGRDIDFMRIRNYWFTATVLLTILGITVFVIRGEQGLNVDFVGGTAYGGLLKDKEDIQQLRDKLSDDAQANMLKVADGSLKQLDDKGLAYQFTYQGSDKPSQVYLHDPVSPRQVQERVSRLPDHSVEQIFIDSPDYSVGNKSRLFTVRTSERERDIVEVVINRLLSDDLQRIVLQSYKVQADPKKIVLQFGDPSGQDNKVYASPAQVAMLLQREFTNQGLESVGRQIGLTKYGEDEEKGRFKAMLLELPQAVPMDKLNHVLKATQDEFASRPQPERLENFDSQLAADTQTRAFYAILASWAAILLYLWFRFGSWTFGAAAVLCLIHDLFFTLGIIAFCHYIHEFAPAFATMLGLQDFKIDLPTVAALLTLVGYSVNDTIVVFDRIREVRGKNPLLTPQMINDGVNQTLSRTLLTSFSVWLVVIVLYIFGGEGVHLFAFVMVVGVVVGTYSSIYIASPLLLIFGEGAPRTPVQERKQEPVRVGV